MDSGEVFSSSLALLVTSSYDNFFSSLAGDESTTPKSGKPEPSSAQNRAKRMLKRLIAQTLAGLGGSSGKETGSEAFTDWNRDPKSIAIIIALCFGIGITCGMGGCAGKKVKKSPPILNYIEEVKKNLDE